MTAADYRRAAAQDAARQRAQDGALGIAPREAQPCCGEPGMRCMESGPERVVCTREIGHSGEHVACGSEHALAVWR